MQAAGATGTFLEALHEPFASSVFILLHLYILPLVVKRFQQHFNKQHLCSFSPSNLKITEDV
jgi:hypothetical protein